MSNHLPPQPEKPQREDTTRRATARLVRPKLSKIREPDLRKNPRPRPRRISETCPWQTLRDFWTAYFRRTGAILKTYSVLRDPPAPRPLTRRQVFESDRQNLDFTLELLERTRSRKTAQSETVLLGLFTAPITGVDNPAVQA